MRHEPSQISPKAPKQAKYANGIDFWRRQRSRKWQQLADDAGISLPVLRRTAKTHYTVFVSPQNGEVLAVAKERTTGGVLSSESLQKLATVLETTLGNLLDTPENLQKNFLIIT